MAKADRDQRAARILDAVIEHMLETGGKLQSAQVAVRAGISTRTLNRYYPDRDQLLYEAAVRYLDAQYSAIIRRYEGLNLSGMSGRQRLLTFMRTQIEVYRRDLTAAAAYVDANISCVYLGSQRNYRRPGFDGRIMALLVRDLEAGIQDGSVRAALDPARTGLLIAANFNGLMQRLAFQRASAPSEADRLNLELLEEYLMMLELYLQPGEESL